jgi:hypothetical protein
MEEEAIGALQPRAAKLFTTPLPLYIPFVIFHTEHGGGGGGYENDLYRGGG